MFRGTQNNPYDDIVIKATDENLTVENWEIILNLCDKVQDEGEQGARNVIAALLKRMTHRNPNVQLYALSLAESLSKNCGVELHRELASRAYTQGLEKLITDRTTHEKVRRRALLLIAMWTAEFENDPTLGVMEDCYNDLKAKNYKFETPDEPPPPAVDDEVRRQEEADLQRALEMSMKDKGGRNKHAEQPSGGSSSAAGGSTTGPAANTSTSSYNSFSYHSAYTTARSPSPTPQTQTQTYTSAPVPSTYQPATSPASTVSNTSTPVVTRVRALHAFEPTEPGELAFDKGDVIKVVDRGYKDWWRGQLKGRTGIFPVNYVEPLPEPTAAEVAKEAEQEAAVFSQAANVDRLLTMLRSLDPTRDNLADNEEIQELYRSSMALRPKIVKLIDKYSQKRADLMSMNETFVKARTIFDRMMEESLARHSGMYDAQPGFAQRMPIAYQPRPNSAPGPQPYGYLPSPYEQAGYSAPSAAASAYNPEPYNSPPPAIPQSYMDPNAYSQQQTPYGQPYGAALSNGPYGLPQAGSTAYPQTDANHSATAMPSAQRSSSLPSTVPQQYSQPQVQDPSPQPPAQQQQLPQAQSQPQAAGPPYAYDPHTTYSDPNVQAWAQYYAQGGKDTTGAVYFISVPGIMDGPAPSGPNPQQQFPAQSDNLSEIPLQGAVTQTALPVTTVTSPDGHQTFAGASADVYQGQKPGGSGITSPMEMESPRNANAAPAQWMQAQPDGSRSPPQRRTTYHQSPAQSPLYGPQGPRPTSQLPAGAFNQPQHFTTQHGNLPSGYPMPSQDEHFSPPPDGNARDPRWDPQYASLQNQMSNMSVGGEANAEF